MKVISERCSQSMMELACQIVSDAMRYLNSRPPCDFDAVAIGSIARGEATPYSDMEYIFLVEESSPAILSYFEKLAVTSYFLIGNLAETKLSYMAIDELKGWFEDTAKNGFKIDGLSEGAGNIPTGNGSENSRNQFIVTAQELQDTYAHVLDHPDPEKSVRGDLSAMLTYTKCFCSTHACKGSFLRLFKESILNKHKNKERDCADMKMLQTDAKKFKFVPDDQFFHKGFNADVKKELYRFPSILLLDICIVLGHVESSSWDTLDSLIKRGMLPVGVGEALRFLLAAATYIRLAAHLHHDSQDDRMSLAQSLSGPSAHGQITKGSITNRWFVPAGLFSEICTLMTPLKNVWQLKASLWRI